MMDPADGIEISDGISGIDLNFEADFINDDSEQQKYSRCSSRNSNKSTEKSNEVIENVLSANQTDEVIPATDESKSPKSIKDASHLFGLETEDSFNMLGSFTDLQNGSSNLSSYSLVDNSFNTQVEQTARSSVINGNSSDSENITPNTNINGTVFQSSSPTCNTAPSTACNVMPSMENHQQAFTPQQRLNDQHLHIYSNQHNTSFLPQQQQSFQEQDHTHFNQLSPNNHSFNSTLYLQQSHSTQSSTMYNAEKASPSVSLFVPSMYDGNGQNPGMFVPSSQLPQVQNPYTSFTQNVSSNEPPTLMPDNIGFWNQFWESDWSKKLKSATDTVLTTLDPGMKMFLDPVMNVVVGSEDAHVIHGVKSAITNICGRADVRGQNVCESTPPSIAVGFETAVNAVNNQLQHLKSYNKKSHVVAIQLFVTELTAGRWSIMVCLGLLHVDHTWHTFSQPIPLPQHLAGFLFSSMHDGFCHISLDHVTQPSADNDWCYVLSGGIRLEKLISTACQCLLMTYKQETTQNFPNTLN